MKKLIALMAVAAMAPMAPLQAEDTPLTEQMDAMNDVYKLLRRAARSGEYGPEMIASVQEAQTAVHKAMTMTPEFVETGGHPDGKEKAMAEYRKQMGELYVLWARMELAILNGDNAAIEEIIDGFRESKKQGHDQFMED